MNITRIVASCFGRAMHRPYRIHSVARRVPELQSARSTHSLLRRLRMRLVTALGCGILASLTAVETANAQGTPTGFINLNFGLTQPVSKTFTIAASEFGASVDVDYHLKRAPIIDVGGGVVFGRG